MEESTGTSTKINTYEDDLMKIHNEDNLMHGLRLKSYKHFVDFFLRERYY